ncbi:MAG: acetoacetyl-CoA reductase [Burkholderiales bacterium]|jgi:acetoacetyl-CoA reductase
MNKKIALVTGGVGGIGTAACKKLVQDGYFVVANFVIAGSGAPWREAMTAAGITASDAVAMHADVSDYDAAGEMAKAIEAQYGPVSVLVNCAGITRDASIRKMTIEQWRAVMSTNLDSAFNMTKHVIEGMIAANWGRIINISSVNGVKGSFGQTNYAAAKAGILGFTKSLALEVAKKGVTVNAISPGFIDTAMTKAIPDAVRAGIVASIPTERMGTPEDIANAISFLASDASSYVTGTNLSVNGGVHMYQ